MDRESRGIIVGMVLGDGHLNVRKRFIKGKYYTESSEMRIVHSIKQKEYVYYKAELIRHIFGGHHTATEYDHAPPAMNGRSYRMCGFSKSNKYFKTLKGIMYPYGIKTISQQVLEMLTPHGIAIWYMDDGAGNTNLNKEGWVSSVNTSITICCSKLEVDLVCDYFLTHHGIEFRPSFDPRRPEGKQYSIRANTFESRNFAALVEPFIIPSMLYKLSHVSNLNLHEHRAPKFVCPICGKEFYGNRHKGLCGTCYSSQYFASRNSGENIVPNNQEKKLIEAGDKEPLR